MRIHALLAIVGIGIFGCAATPAYDPQATESLGQIVSKTTVGTRTLPGDSGSAGPALVGVIGIAGLALVDALQTKTKVPILEYRIRLSDGREVTVVTDYFASYVGDCVKVFESKMPTYPRFISGDGCAK
jgi:hypothetical protein